MFLEDGEGRVGELSRHCFYLPPCRIQTPQPSSEPHSCPTQQVAVPGAAPGWEWKVGVETRSRWFVPSTLSRPPRHCVPSAGADLCCGEQSWLEGRYLSPASTPHCVELLGSHLDVSHLGGSVPSPCFVLRCCLFIPTLLGFCSGCTA